MKKFLAYLLTIAMTAGVVISGTVAYFTDEEKAVNVAVVGNVQIVQHEQQREEDGTLVDFEQYQKVEPVVGDTGRKTPTTINEYVIANTRDKNVVKNYIDKIVSVENTGKNPAYVRTIFAFPTAGYDSRENASAEWLHWNGVSDTDTEPNNGWMWGADENTEWPGNVDGWDKVDNVMISGVEYDLYIATNKNVLEPKDATAPSLLGFYLDSSLNYDEGGYFFMPNGTKTYIDDISDLNILVATQACQTDLGADAWESLDIAFGDITATNHPWITDTIATEIGITEAGTYDLRGDITTIDTGYFHTQKAEAPVTINGNGATVEGNATSVDAFSWEGGTIPAMSPIFSSENGSKVTVNDLTFTGTMSAVMAGNYVDSNSNWFNTEFNNVNIVNAEVVSFSANISPALCVYGNLTMNNCNVYGTTLSKLDTDPMWPVYDMAAVNYTDVTINNSKIGSIYMWNQAKVTVAAGSEVEKIVVRGNMNTTKYGLTIKAGATVDVIDLSAITDKSRVNITIEEGATVGSVVANGKTYESVEVWKNGYTVSNVTELNAALPNGGNITLSGDIEVTDAAGLTFTEDTVLNLNGHNITSTGDALVVTSGTLTINGEGTVKSGDGATNVTVWANGGNVIINSGTYVGSKDAEGVGNDTVYTKNGGTVAIYGGYFTAEGNSKSYSSKQYTCLNKHDSTGGAIVVYGGTFRGFNPANNVSEGAGTNFVAPGYTVSSQLEGNYYECTVMPK